MYYTLKLHPDYVAQMSLFDQAVFIINTIFSNNRVEIHFLPEWIAEKLIEPEYGEITPDEILDAIAKRQNFFKTHYKPVRCTRSRELPMLVRPYEVKLKSV